TFASIPRVSNHAQIAEFGRFANGNGIVRRAIVDDENFRLKVPAAQVVLDFLEGLSNSRGFIEGGNDNGNLQLVRILRWCIRMAVVEDMNKLEVRGFTFSQSRRGGRDIKKMSASLLERPGWCWSRSTKEIEILFGDRSTPPRLREFWRLKFL